MTSEELHAWDLYAAAAVTATGGTDMGPAETAAWAAKLADTLLEERRQRAASSARTCGKEGCQRPCVEGLAVCAAHIPVLAGRR